MQKFSCIVLSLFLLACSFTVTSCKKNTDADDTEFVPVTFVDQNFKQIVSGLFDVAPEDLTTEHTALVTDVFISYYPERIGSSNEYEMYWGITVCKEGYKEAFEKYYDTPEEERKGLENPADYSYYEKIQEFNGYADMQFFVNLKRFDMNSESVIMHINPLQFMQNLAHLEEISLYNFEVPDLTYVQKFKNLKSLGISIYTRLLSDGETLEQIKDLMPLTGLTKLESLYLGGNNVSNLAPLSKLPNLKSLSVTTASLGDISSVKSLKGLEEVDFYFNGISDVEPLTYLPNLRVIRLDYNYISDVSPFEKLDPEIIESISMDMNPIENVDCLKHLGENKVYVGYELYWDENFE